MPDIRPLIAALAMILLLGSFAAWALLGSTSDPAEQFVLLGASLACGVGAVMCWWVLALERLFAR